MRLDFALQDFDQFRLHVVVVIADSQDDQAFAAQEFAEALAEFVAMAIFHGEQDLGPCDQVGVDGSFGVGVGAGGQRFQALAGGEDGFGRGAAQRRFWLQTKRTRMDFEKVSG
jgi:hypothetical protein